MVLGNIIGKRKRMVSICIRCCDNKGESYRPCNLDRCNSKGTPTTTTTIPLFTSARPTTTTTTPTTTTTTPTTTTITPTPTTTTVPPTTSCPHGCCDKDLRCNDFTFALTTCTDPSRGHLCEKTCGLCSQTPAHTTKPPCIDTDPRCRDFNFVVNVCLDNQTAKICPKICGLCKAL
ncbi:integumentary mucin C.1-like [Saccostrea cucullata]|uniref:integumentary mucin C.1-like n=1 Tax=Saccostrea cuccullata TaxID=36930 RepID=UPI002ED5F200